MVERAGFFIKPVPKYQIQELDPSKGGGFMSTLTMRSPGGRVILYSHVGQTQCSAKGLCAEEALSSLPWKYNYTSLFNLLCQVTQIN
jgi:hypothetical protein